MPDSWSPRWSPISSARGVAVSAFLSQEPAEAAPGHPLHTFEQRAAPSGILLRIKRSQVRILPGAPKFQTLKPAPRAGFEFPAPCAWCLVCLVCGELAT